MQQLEIPTPRLSTFQYQSQLPKLPIPELTDTCTRYLNTIEALLTEDEYAATQQRAKEFAEKEGVALQEKLKAYAVEKCSYIEEFWNDSYLNTDESVVLNLNPFFILEDDPTPSRHNQIARAASLIISSLKFIHAIRSETLEPDVWRNIPLCMYQFQCLFGCTRVPSIEKRDTIELCSTSRHIVVLCRNQFYYFDVIWGDGSIAITEKELLNNLRVIQEEAHRALDSEVALCAVGVLTTEQRHSWAKYRTLLLENNSDSLKIIDQALFLVCLDNTSPDTTSDIAATALHGSYSISEGVQTGTCINRWYDKLQIIVCENGVAGVNFEHSTVDGHTVLRFVSDIFTDTIIRFAQTIRGNTQSLFANCYSSPRESKDPYRPDISPRKLEWKLSPEIIYGIKYAEANLSDLILQNEVKVLEFSGYGKQFIVNHNLSPDAFVQMAFLASYFAMYGVNVNQYEPVLTKKFLHGRTEAARSMTPQAAAFVRIFCSSDTSPLEKVGALRQAAAAQVDMVKRCSNGHGVDRHLFALRCLWDMDKSNSEKELPSIFRDIGWHKLNETILSTSNCGNPSLRLFGFGPVVPHGFGIGYIIKDEGIQFCASSKHRQTTRYLDTLETYLIEIQQLLLNERKLSFPNLLADESPSRMMKRSLSNSAFVQSTAGGYTYFDAGRPSEDNTAEEDNRVGKKLV